jgi:hypothetical protein
MIFNKIIPYLHESVEANKQVLKVVEGERSSITYLIQKMNPDLVKLKVTSDVVIDIDIQNEIIRKRGRVNSLETFLQTKSNIIENPIHELLKTILQKL